MHKVDSIAWLAKLTCNVELAIREIWASSSFVFSWPSRMELRTSSILSWLIRVEPSLSLMGLTFDELVIQRVEISMDFGFGLSYRLNTGLWCCSGVSSMLMGFSTVIGLELELIAWVSSLDSSFWSWPNSPFSLSLFLYEQALFGQLKLGHHLHQPSKQNKHIQHAMQF